MSKKKLEQKHTRAKTHKSTNTQGQNARANAHRSKKTQEQKHTLSFSSLSPPHPGFPPLYPFPPPSRTHMRARACDAMRGKARSQPASLRPPSPSLPPSEDGAEVSGVGIPGLARPGRHVADENRRVCKNRAKRAAAQHPAIRAIFVRVSDTLCRCIQACLTLGRKRRLWARGKRDVRSPGRGEPACAGQV